MGNMTKQKQAIPSLENFVETLESEAEERFRGCFEHKLDTKGRVSIPSEFREVLQAGGKNQIVVTNYVCDGFRCLEAFSLKVWKNLEDNLAKRSRFEPKLKILENYYLSRAQICPLDNVGRINLSKTLLSYAGLERDITFTSTVLGFRIWDSRVWNLIFEQAESQLLENPELFVGIDVEEAV